MEWKKTYSFRCQILRQAVIPPPGEQAEATAEPQPCLGVEMMPSFERGKASEW